MDRLITEFVSDTSRFNLNNPIAAVQNLGSAVLRTSELLAGAGVAGFVAFTGVAIREASKIQSLTATFAALSGSFDIAGQKIGFLKKFALESSATFDDLAQAGTLLEASGVRMERIIPLISNIAGAFGGAKETVLELASAFGRLTSGQFGESMEIFRRFGIGARDLIGQGITISKGGEIKASVDEIFRAVENIAKQRFGRIGDFLKDSLQVKFSNLQDAWNQLLEAFGNAWFPLITRILDSVTPFVNFLTQSGVIERIGKGFAGLFTGFGTGGIIRFLAYTVALLEDLPNVIRTVFGYFSGIVVQVGGLIGLLYQGISDTLVDVGRAIDSLKPPMQKLADLAGSISNLFRVWRPGLNFNPGGPLAIPNPPRSPNQMSYHTYPRSSPFEWGQSGPASPQRKGLEEFLNKLPKIGDYFKGTSIRADDLMKLFKGFGQDSNPFVPDTGPYLNTPGQGVNDTIQHKIEANTRKTAENMSSFASDLRRYVVGGGPLAQVGVTPSELGAFQNSAAGGGDGSGQIQVNVGNRKLSEAITEITEQVVIRVMKSKPWGHTRFVR